MAKLYFRYAAMNAGKSTALLQAAYNYEERGMAVLLFTGVIDVVSQFYFLALMSAIAGLICAFSRVRE